MDDITSQLGGLIGQVFTLANFIFCLAVFAIVWVPRKFISLRYPQLEKNKYYTGLVLPMLPLLVGGIIALCMPHYVYPAMFAGKGARVLYGVFCGMMSSHVYKVIKSLLKKAGDNSPESSDGIG